MYTSIDRDQEQRLEQDLCIEEVYQQGFRDGFEGWLPVMSEITYLQGYGKGMEEGRATVKLSICVPAKQLQSERKVCGAGLPTQSFSREMFGSQTEMPLLCGQCQYLNNGRCSIKDIDRNSSQYACDRVSIDCPF